MVHASHVNPQYATEQFIGKFVSHKMLKNEKNKNK